MLHNTTHQAAAGSNDSGKETQCTYL